MYSVNDKRRIYWLINQYLTNKINAWNFCKEYHECYDLELDLNTLTPPEVQAFSELSDIAGRFSDIEEDLHKYPGTYFNETQLKRKLVEIKKLLNI